MRDQSSLSFNAHGASEGKNDRRGPKDLQRGDTIPDRRATQRCQTEVRPIVLEGSEDRRLQLSRLREQLERRIVQPLELI